MFTVIFQKPSSITIERAKSEAFLYCLSMEDASGQSRLALYLTADEIHDLRDVISGWNADRSIAA